MAIKFDEYLLIVSIIIFGAIVHATSQLKISREKKAEFTALDFTILFIIACFAWLIFWLVATLFLSNIIWIILASAIGAFLGLTWLNKVANILLDIIASKALNWNKKTDETGN